LIDASSGDVKVEAVKIF